MISITTDYVRDKGSPEPYLRDIADAGFTHVHWCHHWNTDFLYSGSEIRQIATWLDGYGLAILDIHASHGREKAWASANEYTRQSGVELVKNRIHMASVLGSDVIILHLPSDSVRVPRQAAIDGPQGDDPWLDRVRRSLDDLAPYAQDQCVRIALENMGHDDFGRLRQLFALYPADFLGLCYDAGHGNLGGEGLLHLEETKGRLISVHLHDNDGTADQHRPVFSGTVDWEWLSRIVASSAYGKCVSMEVSIRSSGYEDERAFLRHVYDTGIQLSSMVARA